METQRRWLYNEHMSTQPALKDTALDLTDKVQLDMAARHQRIINDAVGQSRLEGIELDPETIDGIRAALEGKITFDQAVENIIERYRQ